MSALITKVTARAFGYPGIPGGGNPVTVFLWREIQSPAAELRASLAASCKWESVLAHLPRAEQETGNFVSATPCDNRLYFYMPSGEEVTFCAHAAMGAAAVIANENPSMEEDIQFTIANDVKKYAKILNKNEIELDLGSFHEETKVEEKSILRLLNQIDLNVKDSQWQDSNLPCLNSSVARHKTLVPIASLKRLHSASNPKDPCEFKVLCDEIESTGLYLYCKFPSASSHDVLAYECRQFPRGSGYPEDPATGIAAAALASSIYSRKFNDGSEIRFEMTQGTAMGKKSLINIEINGKHIRCSGLVEIDSKVPLCVNLDGM